MYRTLNEAFYSRAVVFVTSTAGLTFLAFWSFFEASFWFIAPDFLLVIFALLSPVRKNKFFLVAFIASFFGGIFYFILNIFALETMGEILRQTPFVADRMIVSVTNLYEQHGHLGILYQSFSFMSFKIWTHIAVVVGLNFFIYFVFVMISRVIRLYAVTWIFSKVSGYVTGFLKRHFTIVLVGYVVIFLGTLILIEK